MKYHVSYIEDPSQDVDIEADDLNLGEQTVSFLQDPKGTSFVKTIAILTLVPGMKIIGDDIVVLAEELPIGRLALVVPDPPSTIRSTRNRSMATLAIEQMQFPFMPPPAPLPTELHNLKVNRLEPGQLGQHRPPRRQVGQRTQGT